MTLRREGNHQLMLVPMHGNLDKKPRAIDRDVSTIGRARGCDLRLDAAEISTMHCIVYRTTTGYRVRDCGSRTGTRVNGLGVKNSELHDSDVLQLGPFSFEIRIPASLFTEGKQIDPVQVERWLDSRRRLAATALKLRRRLRAAGQTPGAGDDELHKKIHQLKEKLHGYEQRFAQMEEAERDLETDRVALGREREEQRRRVQQVEAELADRLAQTDQAVHQRWVDFQQRCQIEEARLLEQGERLAVVGNPEEIKAKIEQLAVRAEQLSRDQEEFETMRQEWTAQQDKGQAELDKQRTLLAQQEASVRAQRNDVARMLGELKQVQEELRRHRKDLPVLERENHELKQRLAQCEQQLAAAAARPDVSEELADIRAENDLLRQMMQEKDQVIEQLQHQPALAPPPADVDAVQREAEQLRGENEVLRQLLEAKQEIVQHAGAGAPRQVSPDELESFEAELNQFRQQLEADRAKLQEEWEQIRMRNEELDEATRDMEMQMSRERAELARERTRVDRLREELKADVEKAQRGMAVLGTLGGVQRLREEIQQRRAGARS